MDTFTCTICKRQLKNLTGLKLHQRKCSEKLTNVEETVSEKVSSLSTTEKSISSKELLKIKQLDSPNPENGSIVLLPVSFKWGSATNYEIEERMKKAYEKIVFWRKNLFLLPTGKAGKSFIDEITRLLNAWEQNSPMQSMVFTAIMVMPSLLLQKPSKESKAKDHSKALERRLTLWQNGDIDELLDEAEAIQHSLPELNTLKSIGDISKKFANCMRKGNVNGALKLLTSNMKNGILPLNDSSLNMLKQKHPQSKPASDQILLPDIPKAVHPIIFENITVDTIRKAAMRTKGGSGPSNLDSDGWRRILLSNSFGDSSENLCQALARVTKKLCRDEDLSSTLEPLLSCRLIPLNKNPGLRPIGVGEVLRRIIGKAVVAVTRDKVVNSVGSLQVGAGHKAGCEAAIHSMKDIYEEEDTEAVLLIDASNAFNSINREAFLHNIRIVCPEIAIFVTNCYQKASRLFIIGGIELSSTDGTTQGDPLGMAIYSIAVIPLLLMILEVTDNLPGKRTKAEAYADDFKAAGVLENLKEWWKNLLRLGPLFGYNPEETKCWLIVKPNFVMKCRNIFGDTEINVTTEGSRHLGAVIGSEGFKATFVTKKIDTWCEELELLSRIAEIEPHAAYTCFIGGFKHKLTFLMRTVPGIVRFVKKIDEIILTEFIPAITGGIRINEVERKLLSLSPKDGGLGIPIFEELSPFEYENSRIITASLVECIKSQERSATKNNNLLEGKNKIKSKKSEQNETKIRTIEKQLDQHQRKLVELNKEPEASSWLTTLPLADEGYHLNKQCFRDLIRIRYGWNLQRLPSSCECGTLFSIEHALSCKKGGFVSMRHNQIRNFTSKALREVCHDVSIEPSLQILSGNESLLKTSNKNDEARLDVAARGFWITSQKAFFDIRIFNPLAKRYGNLDPQKCYDINEKEKKRFYNNRVIDIEHGSFTPLVFSATGGRGREAKKFFKRLAEMISEKKKSTYSDTITWFNRKLNFSLIKSLHICIRGSRSPLNKTYDSVFGIDVAESMAEIKL